MDAHDNWEAAEEFAAAWLRAAGFDDAVRTSGGADGGVDVAGRAVVAQVKAHARPTGRPAIQQLRGAAMMAPNVCFFSTSGYSSQAVEYADEAGVALFTISGYQVVAENGPAFPIASRVPDEFGFDPLVATGSGRPWWQWVAIFYAAILLGPFLFIAASEARRRRAAPTPESVFTGIHRVIWIGGAGTVMFGGVILTGVGAAVHGDAQNVPDVWVMIGLVFGAALLVMLHRLVPAGRFKSFPVPERLLVLAGPVDVPSTSPPASEPAQDRPPPSTPSPTETTFEGEIES